MNLPESTTRFKNLDCYPRPEQKRILDKLALELFLRKGRMVLQIERLRAVIHLASPGMKFNPYHDPDNGQFTFGPGGPEDDRKPDGQGSGTTSYQVELFLQHEFGISADAA